MLADFGGERVAAVQTQGMEYTDVHMMHVVSESVSPILQLSEVGEGRRSRSSSARDRTDI